MESKQCKRCGEEKELTAFSKNRRKKDGHQNECRSCHAERRADNKDYLKKERERYQRRKESKLAQGRVHYAETAEQQRQIKRDRYNNGYRDKQLAINRLHYRNNKADYLARNNKRRIAKIKRTPAWADNALINAFYDEARRLTDSTGIQHHVDHIIPLQGELVSGLHVETNLQVLTAHENMSKGNRYSPVAQP
jgi:hypothetical protein